MTNQDEEQEEPLDPKLEYIRRRMIRLLLVSIGILFAGLIAVFAAIIYRVNEDTPDKSQRPISEIPGNQLNLQTENLLQELNLTAPNGAEFGSVQLDGTLLLVTWNFANSGSQLWIVDLTSGEVVSRISID